MYFVAEGGGTDSEAAGFDVAVVRERSSLRFSIVCVPFVGLISDTNVAMSNKAITALMIKAIRWKRGPII